MKQPRNYPMVHDIYIYICIYIYMWHHWPPIYIYIYIEITIEITGITRAWEPVADQKCRSFQNLDALDSAPWPKTRHHGSASRADAWGESPSLSLPWQRNGGFADGDLPVISTYNPIYNGIIPQFKKPVITFINGQNCDGDVSYSLVGDVEVEKYNKTWWLETTISWDISPIYIYWLVVSTCFNPSEKYARQLGWLYPIWKT